MRAYTTISTILKSLSKSTGLTCKQALLRYKSTMNPENFSDVGNYYSLLIDNEIIEGRCIHIFMPNMEFCDWLVSCVIDLNPSHAAIISQLIGETAGCIHFPRPTKRCSFGFWIPKYTRDSNGMKMSDYGFLNMSFSKENTDDLWACNVILRPNPNPIIRPISLWYAKLIVGLGMYLSCFPDQTKPGIPDDLKHANYYQGQKRTIGISEEVVMRDGPTPHYRVGHFRMLQSDRYTNKRGQAIFVHGCFVKGKAETVLAPQ